MLASPDVARSVVEWGRPDRHLPQWRGVGCQQFPADLWRYAELCWAFKPPFVVEVGVAAGGTALFLADVLHTVNGGQVIGVDVRPPDFERYRNLVIVKADSTDPGHIRWLTKTVASSRGIVLLDGNHQAAHVAQELDLYAPLADYLVVEDTIMEYLQGMDDGPHQALKQWLPNHPEFAVDPDPVPGPTQHPGGWLRRVSG